MEAQLKKRSSNLSMIHPTCIDDDDDFLYSNFSWVANLGVL